MARLLELFPAELQEADQKHETGKHQSPLKCGDQPADEDARGQAGPAFGATDLKLISNNDLYDSGPRLGFCRFTAPLDAQAHARQKPHHRKNEY